MPPVVVVRRARGPEALETAVSRAEVPTPAAPTRPARVFRVVGGTAYQAGPGPAPQPEPTAHATPEPALSPRRNRRADTGRRPGPVRIIVEAPKAQAPSPVPPAADAMTHKEELETLAAMMSAVDAVLGEIMRARGLVFLD